MRIDSAITGVPDCSLAGRKRSSDQVSGLIEPAAELEALTRAVIDTDAIREDLVALVRQRLASGEYFTDSAAARTIDAFLGSDIDCAGD